MQAFIWMRRLAGGFADKELKWPGKLPIITELLGGELWNEKVIIWCDFVLEIDHVVSGLKAMGVESVFVHGGVAKKKRPEIVKRFSQGTSVQAFVAQSKSFEEGTDLSASDAMLYYSTPLSLKTRLQTEDRFVKIGKKNSLLVVDCVTDDTVDRSNQKSLRRKEKRDQMMRRMITDVKERAGRR